MGKRNRIYDSLYNFACPKIDDKTGKKCTGKLHPTNQYSTTLEFKCHTCGKYTTASYKIANIIMSDTKKSPTKYKGVD